MAQCAIDNCDRPVWSKELCRPDYQRRRAATAPPCSIEGCSRPAHSGGWCSTHDGRNRRHGTPYPLTPIRWAPCRLCGRDVPSPAVRSARALCRGECDRLARNARSLDWTRDNPERFAAQQRASYDRHREARLESNRQWREANPDKALAIKTRRRAREGVEFEPVDRLTVFERDGWVCQLCTAPVGKTISHPDPLSPSLDHVVPLVAGGAHTYANTQLAHLICNVRKGGAL